MCNNVVVNLMNLFELLTSLTKENHFSLMSKIWLNLLKLVVIAHYQIIFSALHVREEDV